MADTFDVATRSWIMSRVVSSGTRVEECVRSALRASSYRFSSQAKNLPGRPDFVIPRLRIAIFVNGCFWHWHGCKRCRMPASNRAYWEDKIARNVKRDKASKKKLSSMGWHYSTIWECSLDLGIARLFGRMKTLADVVDQSPAAPDSLQRVHSTTPNSGRGKSGSMARNSSKCPSGS